MSRKVPAVVASFVHGVITSSYRYTTLSDTSSDETDHLFSVSFHAAHFHSSVWFNGAEFHGSIWFVSAHFCSTFRWTQFDGFKSQIEFTKAFFRVDKATILVDNGGHIPKEILENAVFSADCPLDSSEEPE